jgi:hypothetical protein
MNILSLYLQFEFGKFKKYFATRALAKVITMGLFFVVFGVVAVGIYSFFISGFRYINYVIEPEFRLPLTLLIYELFLLVLSGVIVASSIVSAIFNLFRGENDAWLLSSPGYKRFPNLIFTKSILTSLWPLLVMFLPAVFAFNKIYSLGFGSLFLIIVSVILLSCLTSAITLSVVVLLGYLYYVISRTIRTLRFTFKGFVALLLVAIIGNVAIVWKTVASLDLVTIFKADDADALVTVANIGSYFTMFPTHPFAMEIIQLQTGAWQSALLYGGILFLVAVLAVILWFFVSPLFYPLWQAFQEGGSQSKGGTALVHGSTSYSFKGNALIALLKKEALVSSRNFKAMLWFFFVSFIWLIQIGASFIMEHNIRRHEADISLTLTTLQTIQFVSAAYFISAFTLRFVFPAFSVEKKAAWILGTAPLSTTKIFFAKYVFYTVFFVALGVFMNYVNVNVLDVLGAQALYSTLLLVSVIVFIVTLGLTLGALFPNRETDDPEVISTSMSGLFFTALALTYGGAGAWVLRHSLLEGNVSFLVAFVAISIAVVVLTLLAVPRLLTRKF